MIDSHNHIDAEAYQTEDGVKKILAQARESGVTRVVAPSLHLESFARLQALREHHPSIYPAVGIHPHEATPERLDNLQAGLESALAQLAVPILGETGLEGHYNFTDMDTQLDSLRVHLKVAKKSRAPIILHCREAEEQLYRELVSAALPGGGVIHCFTGSWAWAKKFLALGFHIGITGIVTFKNSLQVQEVAGKLPVDRLLVETDGPYLAPVPFRGKTNKPEYIPHIVNKIAELRSVSPQEIARQTVKNTEALFRLPPLPA